MAKLILKFNNEIIDHIDLAQGDMKIGRKPSCEIFVDNLAVSGEHANIFTIGDDSFVQDLGSTNGTFVNNKKITKHHLRNGDVITIGKHSMVFFAEAASQEENTEDFAKTVIISPSSKPESTNTESMAIANETLSMQADKPKTNRIGAIFVLSGPNSGKRIELSKTVTNLGKTGKVAGSIVRTASAYKLSAGDTGETPKLNGRALDRGSEQVLKNGDIIEVTGTRLQFYFK
ncbi:MAG: FHA domain-containing protein [Gammaproteobacteria bacterium]|nr:FHA domain-containing protein [Gammaproteobacteria bacterium]